MFPSMRPLFRLGQAIAEWPVASQQQARRNAMIALTACARRRAEREEVASYLARLSASRRDPATGTAPAPGVVANA
ncbi:hypothetical protein D0Z08_06780 [Nocardioides immobilis]|uniref:Uncharacterized protein n=2 Tax=Nocardioides immobilis TaxID=2049295 RepID=A0A417Y5R3_9ACTN|nr:hypothetical protein D0Z08_06780 [Nocardioides immobilis]